jgi:hypothetical protein
MMILFEAIGVMHCVLTELQVEEGHRGQRMSSSEACHPL